MDISSLHDRDLKPRVIREPGKGAEGTWLNVDAAILQIRLIDTEKARKTYRAYLKHRRALERQGRTGQQARMDALMAAIEEMGGKMRPVPIKGVPFNVMSEDR
jgi:uncharacterized protein YigE (DUF2233 family)